ncbi:MAG: hypothetical protein JWQ27_473 [Ferruginibacter sp.]|nr:hypothetical protein [Ferruginibacter sp.]
MKLIFTLLSLVFFTAVVSAQQTLSVRGIVKSNDGKPVSGATVILFAEGSKDSVKAVSSDKGLFSFKNVAQANTGVIVTSIGYDAFAQYYDYTKATGEQNIVDISLVPGGKTLETVTVSAAKVQIKEDTVSYKIDSTMFRKNDNVEEVLKKLPGVEVDKAGTVTAQGQQVTKVKVNGKEFFGGDVTTATRQINADMVDKIDIIDDYGDQAAFTGVKSGDATKTINIQLKKDKNKGYFGNASLGAGTEGRYANSLTINKFNNAQQISLIGNLNNTNASTFNFGNMGGAMGGMARSIGGAFGNFGSGNGIATTKSIGLNYRDQWGPKISVYGSYAFTNKAVRTIKDETRQNIFKDGTVTNNNKTNDYTITDNHRLTYNMEFKIDSFNYLKFSPTVNYTTTNSDYLSNFGFLGKTGDSTSQGFTTDRTHSTSPNLSGSLLFNHRFDKKGRILSLNLNAGKSNTEGNDTYDNLTTYYDLTGGSGRDSILRQFITQDNDNHNYGISASYIQPFNKKQSLEFNYAYNKSYTSIDRENYLIDNGGIKRYVDSLSNIYDNEYVTNRFGVNFRNNQKKYNYTVGFAVQPATIQSNSVTSKLKYKQDLVNYYPVVRFAYNFSKSRSFSVNYNGSTRQPSYSQLQPVYDYSNPQYITIGNPDLKPEFTNTLGMRYNNFDFITGNVFFGNLNFSLIKDKIVNNTFPLYDDSNRVVGQETRYVNTDGYYTASGFYAFSKPIQNRKYVFNYGGNLLYTNSVAFAENIKNTGQNWVLGQRFNTTITIKKWLETSAGVNFTLNQTKYSSGFQRNSTTKFWSLTHSSRIFLPKDLTINYDLDKSINSGYSASVDANPFIINASIEKLVSKKFNASVKLNAYDLLDQNTSVSRNVTGTSIVDTRTNRLGRYLMLGFVFRFNKFTGTGTPPAPTMGGMMIRQ